MINDVWNYKTMMNIFRCPVCKLGGLLLQGNNLGCEKCGARFDVEDDVPYLLPYPKGEYWGSDLEYFANFRKGRIVRPKRLENYQYNEFMTYHPDSFVNSYYNIKRMICEYDVRLCNFVIDFIERSGLHKSKLLNIGSGLGTFDLSISKRFRELKITGVDLIFEGCKVCQWNIDGKPLQYICGDACNLPFQDNSFDLIYSKNTVEHTGINMIYEMYRVLRPGGKALLIGPGYLASFTRGGPRRQMMLLYKRAFKHYGEHDAHGFKVSTYGEVIRKCGFELLNYDALCFNSIQRDYKEFLLNKPKWLIDIVFSFNLVIEEILKSLNLKQFLWMQIFEMGKKL